MNIVQEKRDVREIGEIFVEKAVDFEAESLSGNGTVPKCLLGLQFVG